MNHTCISNRQDYIAPPMKHLPTDFLENSKIYSTRRVVHGGVHSLGRRKSRRPLSLKKPVHVVLASKHAVGERSFRTKSFEDRVTVILRMQAKKFGVKLLQMKNGGTKIHLLVKISSRAGFQNFLRSTSALIARLVTGAKKGNPFGKFWDALAFSRVLQQRKEFQIVQRALEELFSSILFTAVLNGGESGWDKKT